MPIYMAVKVLAASTASLMFLGGAAYSQTSMTSQSAQSVLLKNAEAGRIEIQNGALDGSWFMERRVTGIVSSGNCDTDFAAPRSTRLVKVSNPANHYLVYWSALKNIRVDGDSISFDAPATGNGNFAKFVVKDNAARAEVLQAIQTLARNCGAEMTSTAPKAVTQTAPSVAPVVQRTNPAGLAPSTANRRWITRTLPGTTTKYCEFGDGDTWEIQLTEGVPLYGKDGRDLSFKATAQIQIVAKVGISAKVSYDGPVSGPGRAQLTSVDLQVPWDKAMARLDISVDDRSFRSWDDEEGTDLIEEYAQEAESGYPPLVYEWEPASDRSFNSQFASGKKLSARAIGANRQVLGSWFPLDLAAIRGKISEVERMNWKCPR